MTLKSWIIQFIGLTVLKAMIIPKGFKINIFVIVEKVDMKIIILFLKVKKILEISNIHFSFTTTFFKNFNLSNSRPSSR